MKKLIVALCLLAGWASPVVVAVEPVRLYPVQDGQIVRTGDGHLVPNEVHGQWWCNVAFNGSEEKQLVLEFDPNELPGGVVVKAMLHVYVDRVWAFDVLSLEVFSGPGNGVVDETDYEAGIRVGSFGWTNPVPGSHESILEEHVTVDVTDALVAAREAPGVMFGLRLAGDIPDFVGNVFNLSGSPAVLVPMSENIPGLRPYLDVYVGQCTEPPAGDLNGDCRVNLKDLALLAVDWLVCHLEPAELCEM